MSSLNACSIWTMLHVQLPERGGVLGDHVGTQQITALASADAAQREALRRDDQRDHHLHAVGPLVPAVAETALAFERRIALEIQVVKQHVEARVEQCRPPPAAQIREEVLLVRRQLVEAAIGRVVGDRLVAAKELLAVLEASFAAHEHGQSVRCFASTIKGVGRHYTRFWKAKARKSDTFRAEKSSN